MTVKLSPGDDFTCKKHLPPGPSIVITPLTDGLGTHTGKSLSHQSTVTDGRIPSFGGSSDKLSHLLPSISILTQPRLRKAPSVVLRGTPVWDGNNSAGEMAYGSLDVILWVRTCRQFFLWLFISFALHFELTAGFFLSAKAL